MVQKPPASSNKCGTRQDEEATQAEDSGSQNGVRFQPAGTEGTGRCKPGHWAEAVTFLKPGNPQKESGLGLAVMHTHGTVKGK